MSINAKLEFEGNVSKFLSLASTETLINLDKDLLSAAYSIDATAKKEISSGTRTGKEYKRGRSGKRGRRSAPSEYPKSDTGSLVRSIRVKQQDFLEVEVGSTVHHGEFLESGTVFMESRPWLEPSFDKEIPKLNSKVKPSIGKAFQIAHNKAR